MVGNQELGLDDYLRILRRRWLPIVGLAVVGGLLSYGVSTRLPKRYTSQTTVLVQQPTVPTDYVRPVVSQDVNQRLAAMQQQILSRSRLEPIIDQFGLYHPVPGQTRVATIEDMVDKLRRAIAVSPVQAMAGTGGSLPGFSISVTLDNPRLAQQLCSTITSMFMEKNLELRQDQAQDTTDFISGQLDQAKAKLDEQDTKLADFKRRNLGALPDQTGMNFNILMGLNSQFESVTQALSQAQQDKGFAEAALAQQIAEWKAAPASAMRDPETMDQQLSALQAQLAGLQLKYTDNYPDVVRLKSNIAILQKRIAESQEAKPATDQTAEADSAAKLVEPAHIQQMRAQVAQLDQAIRLRSAQEDELRNQIKLYQGRVESSPAIEQEYKEVTRDYQTALDLYNDLLRKQAQSAMATDLERRQESEQFTILDPANLPDRPSFPNRLAFGVGGVLAGLALGLGLAILFEMRDTSLRTERDVELILHVPVLAMVPLVTLEGGKKKLPREIPPAGPARLRA